MNFTAHNIVLDDGTETKPDRPVFETTSPFLAVVRTLDLLFPAGLHGVRVIDLACLEGGYSVGIARRGAEVLGIEIRQANFANCEFVKSRVALPNLRFVQDDVRSLARYDKADVILCSGILYHLDRPREFLRLLGQQARKAILVNTHFARQVENPTFGQSLSGLCENEGLAGRWFLEGPPHREEARWASWDNERSFWLTKPSLLQAIKEAGFPIVFEQFDWLGGDISAAMQAQGYYCQQHRNLFVGARP